MPLKNLSYSDLWFTTDGDFLIDGSGDLKDTIDSGDPNEGLRQAIIHRVIGERNALRNHPEISAGINDFIGNTVDKTLMGAIQDAVNRALTSDGSLTKDDYTIRTIELTPGDLALLIYVNLPNEDKPLVTMSWSIQSGDITRIL